MVIYGVSFDMVGKQPIVLLKTADSNKFLPIWIGHPEAAAILMKLQGATTPRPMTHDLLVDMLGELEYARTRLAAERIFAERATHAFPPKAALPAEWRLELENLAQGLGYRTSNAEGIEVEFAAVLQAIATG